MKQKLFIFTIIFYIISFALLTSHFIWAQEAGYELEVGIPGQVEAGAKVGLIDYIKYVFLYGLATIGLAALIALVIGGLMYMSSGSITKTDEAKKWIFGALTGLLLGLSAYLILNTINPDLVNLKTPHLEKVNMPVGQTYPECTPGQTQTITDNCRKEVDSKDCYGKLTYTRNCSTGGYWEKPSEEYLKNLECKDLTCYERALCPDGAKKPQCDASSPPEVQYKECTTPDGCPGTQKKTRACGEDGCYPGWLGISWDDCVKVDSDCGKKTFCTGIGAPTYNSEGECLRNCSKFYDSSGNPGTCREPSS